MTIHDPWFSEWNYRTLQALFHVLPHRGSTDTLFDFLDFNQLVSTWIFAASFYLFWIIDYGRTMWRRCRLFQIVVAFGIAIPITLIVRPWISWPAPVLNPRFRVLYPSYFWGNGNLNSFPSHSTLAYFMVAAGVWPLNRRASLWLSVGVLTLISLPRLYVGGHYPIDVLASLVLVIVVLALVWRWQVPASVASWLVRSGPGTFLREFLLILWVFELGEGFRGSTNILFEIRHYLRH